MAEQMYRIAWKSQITGMVGHGTGEYPKDIAQAIADSENLLRPKIEHSIEQVPSAAEGR